MYNYVDGLSSSQLQASVRSIVSEGQQALSKEEFLKLMMQNNISAEDGRRKVSYFKIYIYIYFLEAIVPQIHC